VTATVAVFASTRADLFPLASVLAALAEASDLDPVLFASGTTANRAFGDPLAAIDLSGIRVEHLADDLASADRRALAGGGIRIGATMTGALERVEPDVLVVLGDRWELLYAIPPALVLGIPIVHLHGGEVTEGAIDDRIRHAISKLADLHCVSTDDAATRLRQLGEPADRIFITGAPSLDRMTEVKPADDAALQAVLGRELVRPLALVTYHPPTAGGSDAGAAATNVLAAVAHTVGTALITHPGLDHGSEEVLAAIAAAVARWPQLVDRPSLGASYLPVLAAADVVVGNSSSGILEAASFGIPVVDVGTRQRGRLRGANVVHVSEDRAAIADAITSCLSGDFRVRARAARNPYGDGRAAPRIVEVVRSALSLGADAKPFVDVPRRGES
jgi:UDP-N-acetylglucosamine 2-epimerase (non-hydrolysing)